MSTAITDRLGVKVVPRHVAMHPVARAIARTQLRNAVRDFQIRLHMLADGEDVAADVQCAMVVLTVCLETLAILGRTAEPDAAVMRGAQSTLLQCAQRGARWRTADLPAVSIGLQRAVETYPSLPARETALAWQRLRETT